MSHELNNLLSAYQRLSGDKSTDRRKAAESLRGLLESEEVKNYIDSSSAGQRGRSGSSSSSLVTWDGLFNGVVDYVIRECEAALKLDREKPVASAGAQTSRKKMKQDIVDTMRAVLKSAHSRGGCLSVLGIMDHFSLMLTQRHFQSWMVSDYSHMLLNYVLTCPRYLLDAPPTTWTDLLAIYCKLFQSSISSSSTSLDRSILARVIHSIISHCVSNCDLPAAQLYMFFQSATKNISQEQNSTVLEHLLAGLNGYCVAVATSSRGRLCKLGEEICPQLLQAWARSPPPVKDQLIEFLRIQVRVHHPQGAHTDDDGAWAGSDLKWKSILNKVHELVLSECETTTNRLRWASKSDGSVSILLIDLAVDVIHQIFYFNDNQEESRRTGRRIEPSQAKRRRLDTNWSSLVDLLSTNTTNPSIMTWLQLAGHLLLKWPNSLSLSSYPALLSQLHKVQIETKS